MYITSLQNICSLHAVTVSPVSSENMCLLSQHSQNSILVLILGNLIRVWLPQKLHLENGFATARGTIQSSCIDFLDVSSNAEILKNESHTPTWRSCSVIPQACAQVGNQLQWSNWETATMHKGTLIPLTDTAGQCIR